MKPALKPVNDPVAEQLYQLMDQYKKDYSQVKLLQQFIELGMTQQRFDIVEENLQDLLKWGQQQQYINFLLATVQEKQGNYVKAAVSVRRLFASPGDKTGPMYSIAARVLPRTGEQTDLRYLLQLLEEVLKIEPDHSGLINNIADTYRLMGRHNEAEALYRDMVSRHPFDYTMHCALAVTEMVNSDLTKGFDHYDHRFEVNFFKMDLPFMPWPKWKGEPLKGKKLYLWVEQGVGDMIMWAGLFNWLIPQGAEITCAVYPKMLSLFQRSFPSVNFVKRYNVIPLETLMSDFDYQCPIGNLMPLALPEYTPAEHGPYLIPDKEAVAKKRAEYLALVAGAKKLVGVSWHTTAEASWRRNIDLMDLHPLLNEPDTVYISLQYSQRLDDVDEYNKRNKYQIFNDLSFLAVDDMDAWAAQIAAMDHVVSIQNSAVHMAGALGVPATLLLSTYGSWHWGSGDTNKWYKNVDIYRQKPGQPWKSLAKQAARGSKEK